MAPCNPENPTHWLKTFIDSDIDIYLQQYRLFDNRHLPREYVENLCKEYAGTIYYDRLIEESGKEQRARFTERLQTIRREFIREVKPEKIKSITIGIDFGGNGSGHSFVATAKLRDGKTAAVMSRKHMKKDFPQGN